jgi:predicted dehydrogenase
MRRNIEACEEFARRHQIPYWTNQADILFKDPEINAIYIATPPDTHAYYTTKAAEAGKMVYVEKPMARNYNECLEMISACKKANVPLFVAYYRRSLPHFLRIKELIEKKHLGNIQSVNIIFNRSLRDVEIQNPDKIWRLDPNISGGGHFHDLASHQLDLLDFFFGPALNVNGTSINRSGYYKVADSVQAELVFKDQVIARGIWNFACSQEEVCDEIHILGNKGNLSFSTFAHSRIQGYSTRLGKINEEYQLPKHIQEYLIRTIVSQFQGISSCPSTGESASRTSKVMDIICNNS